MSDGESLFEQLWDGEPAAGAFSALWRLCSTLDVLTHPMRDTKGFGVSSAMRANVKVAEIRFEAEYFVRLPPPTLVVLFYE